MAFGPAGVDGIAADLHHYLVDPGCRCVHFDVQFEADQSTSTLTEDGRRANCPSIGTPLEAD